MEWIEAKVDFDADEIVVAEELLCEVFDRFDVHEVVIEDPTLAVPPGMDVLATDDVRSTVHAVSGYFPADAFDQGRRQRFEKALSALGRQLAMRHRVFYRSLDQEDWAESWKAFFWPEKVSTRMVVKPTWRDYQPVDDELVLEIDPGMAFGTGSHPTTALCIQFLEKHLRPGDRLLDVGTGSGILMAAAWLQGAAEVHGVDNDPVAVNVARQNLLLNGVPAESSRVWTGTLVTGVSARYDFVVANILAPVILGLLPVMPGVLAPDGRFVCSGILESQQDEVVEKARNLGFQMVETVVREEWVTMAMTLGAPGVSMEY
jgi:ribosomal protein L11 methyltransferase